MATFFTPPDILRLGGNRLTGTTPIHLFLLKKLGTIATSQFAGGKIPPFVCLTDIDFVVELGLQGNRLTGTFPPEIDSLQFLQRLDLSGNQLVGELPEVFLRLHALSKCSI